ncbi:tRNA (guanosine(46)-N7)-methyltransferase TrmB [Campylobacter sp. 19-13652]|uniref:tRNA (guanosine(46)-N7)-methyltransferase TrmB n=1 Tax=Campylobacter sp. 19-13652 TaxID=2840180 RepID=UPI001C75C1BF|nr:tRNA (guanosine(46)-N7)-methyltransferase TrmB [Campylobacter sp. 19-13652]BCX79746.1 tRNA (guanine-N(7)-)-methyltransferase [Campylobacter sp. 19-13652]
MPNFRAKSLKPVELVAKKDAVEFVWEAHSNNGTKLIFTKVEDAEFFILVKSSKDAIVVKGEKISKPARIGILQKALLAYRDLAQAEIINEAVELNKNRLVKKDSQIIEINEFEAELKNLADKFKRIFIEIGFGSGRHLLYQASQNPNTLIIGIEVYKPSIEQVAKLAKAQNLQNIRLLNTDARLVMALLKSNSIDKIFLHFPVPWPKAPHRRVASEAFALECERILKDGGCFELRTDEKDYASYTAECFLSLHSPKLSIAKNKDLSVISKYEARWRKLEKDIYDIAYHCDTISTELENAGDFSFNTILSPELILREFKDTTIKKDGYFFHLERAYKTSQNAALLRVSLGGFYAPEHCYLLITDKNISYFIKAPLRTKDNLKAHEAMRDFLNAEYNKRK